MRILLVNPPHTAMASRCHKGKMPPLGLLSVGGPLLDAGHDVRLLDADVEPLSATEVVSVAASWEPHAILMGHSGSTSAHPQVTMIAEALKATMPNVLIVYGGVFPTYHAADILSAHPEIDVIVRGEGEATTLRLMSVLEDGSPLSAVAGIAYRVDGAPCLTPPADTIQDLDLFRVGWELVPNWDAYHYWGAGRAAVLQFSRGCPHRCSYCGQREFWVRWRSRDPRRVAKEIAWLHRTHGVRLVDLADENPTSSKQLWRAFLEALIDEDVPVQLIATIRADDIVRDADILHLYKRAGFSRILMGIETTDANILAEICKDSVPSTDREAIRLLRQHDILSQVAYVVGFAEETDRDYLLGIRRLLSYDPDQINAMYVTPHRWTECYRENANRHVVESHQRYWDYRHQVLAARIPAWRVFFWLKLTEVVLQLRPRAIRRVFAHPDPSIRKALRWCYGVGRRAWFYEVVSFMKRRRYGRRALTLAEFWGAPQDTTEDEPSPVLGSTVLVRHRDGPRETPPQRRRSDLTLGHTLHCGRKSESADWRVAGCDPVANEVLHLRSPPPAG